MTICQDSVMPIILLLSALLSPAFAAEGQTPKPWKGSAEFSLVNANGNTKSSTFSNKDRFEYASGPSLLELEAGALRSTTRAQLIAEQYFASEKAGYKWSDRDYVFERFRWDKDRFAGVNNRFDASVGYGRKILDRKPDLLVGEAGVGHVWEERLPPPRNDYASGRGYARYERALSATSGFFQDVEYLHSFKQARNYRLKTETAVTAAINTLLSLKLSFIWKRAGMPPPGFIKDDTILAAALIVSL
jgi:putative salt-induced outer membrane protein YdiY